MSVGVIVHVPIGAYDGQRRQDQTGTVSHYQPRSRTHIADPYAVLPILTRKEGEFRQVPFTKGLAGFEQP